MPTKKQSTILARKKEVLTFLCILYRKAKKRKEEAETEKNK